MATVSVVIQFFEDFDFIERVVELLAWADEIVVNDGPFQFTRELLEPLVGRDLEQPSDRAAQLFSHLSKRLEVPIHYHYGVFEAQRWVRLRRKQPTRPGGSAKSWRRPASASPPQRLGGVTDWVRG